MDSSAKAFSSSATSWNGLQRNTERERERESFNTHSQDTTKECDSDTLGSAIKSCDSDGSDTLGHTSNCCDSDDSDTLGHTSNCCDSDICHHQHTNMDTLSAVKHTTILWHTDSPWP